MTDIPKLEVIIDLDKPKSPEDQLKALNLLKNAQEESIRAYTHFLQITQINGQEVSPISLRVHLGTKVSREVYSIMYTALDDTIAGKGFSKEDFYNLR